MKAVEHNLMLTNRIQEKLLLGAFLLSISICLVACGDDSESSSGPEYVWVDPSTVTHGTMTDSRDGKTYRTVTIGSQTWMAENLNFEYNEGTARSYCYDSLASNCDKYGRLYFWSAAMDSAALFSDAGKGCGNYMLCNRKGKIRGICPEGWHLPNLNEWLELVYPMASRVYESVKDGPYGYGEFYGAGIRLKSVDGWMEGSHQTDDYGFSALPSGYFLCDYDDGFEHMGRGTQFWSSSELNIYHAFALELDYRVLEPAASDDALISGNHKTWAYSVRCVKD